MNYTNSQILSAVLNKWLQPIVQQLAGQKLSSFPFLSGLENKIRSTGWVSPNWSLSAELAPFMQSLTGTMLEPLIVSYLSKVPDEALPEMAHTLVDQAIANGGITLFDGNVSFDKSDMEELKRLLEFNLLIQRKEHYEVKQPPKTN